MTDRDLDRRVAEAMGHEVPATITTRYVVKHYSTDWSALPEMLAWLRARKINACRWGRDDAGMDEWEAQTDDDETVATVWAPYGAWPLAVCKLVLAVSEKENK